MRARRRTLVFQIKKDGLETVCVAPLRARPKRRGACKWRKKKREAHGGGLFSPPASLGKPPPVFFLSLGAARARARARGRIDRRGGFLGARTPVFTGGVAPTPHGGSDLRADRVFPSPRNNSLLSELYSAARERRYRDRHASSCTRRTTSLPARDRDLCGSARSLHVSSHPPRTRAPHTLRRRPPDTDRATPVDRRTPPPVRREARLVSGCRPVVGGDVPARHVVRVVVARLPKFYNFDDLRAGEITR